MAMSILIRRNNDGEIRHLLKENWSEDDMPRDVLEYLWAHGNFSCDCNRSQFFAEALDPEADGEDKCGDGGYAINLQNPESMEIYYREFSRPIT